MVLDLSLCRRILKCNHIPVYAYHILTICFPVALFNIGDKVVLSFESGDEILERDHSIEGYYALLSRGAVYFAAKGSSNI